MHHVVNRGVARRALFDGAKDMRYFESRVARSARRGEIKVHAFALVINHFHMYVESVTGELSAAMRRIQSEYVRWFNRRNRRDGPLVKTRYWSKRVDSAAYRHILLRYIDGNAVVARLTPSCDQYPFASAHHYCKSDGPIWLTRTLVEREVCALAGTSEYDPNLYRRVFGDTLSPGQRRLVEQRLWRASVEDDPLDDLVKADARRVREWMGRRAMVADGRPGLPIADAESVLAVVGANSGSAWPVHLGRKRVSGWDIVRVALLRDLAGLSYREISQRVRCHRSMARRRYEKHVRALREDPEYARWVLELTRASLKRCHGEC
jgi:REP element-mobilizing transposase RayT